MSLFAYGKHPDQAVRMQADLVLRCVHMAQMRIILLHDSDVINTSIFHSIKEMPVRKKKKTTNLVPPQT